MRCSKCYIYDSVNYQILLSQSLGRIICVYDQDGVKITDINIIDDLQAFIDGNYSGGVTIFEDVTCTDYYSEKNCIGECVSGGEGGFDLTDTLFRCSKIGFQVDDAFTSLCPDNWTPQDLVDKLNEGNPTGTVFEVVSGNIIGVVSGEVPEVLQFFHSGGGSTTLTSVSGGETVCAKRVKDCNSDRQTELLQEIADNTCPSSVTSNVVCSASAQTVNLVSGGSVNLTAGQELLLGEVYDCKGNLQTFSLSVLITGILQEIDSPVETGICPTPPETPVPSGCVKDSNGQEWNVFTTNLNGDSVTYYQDAITGKVGTPVGDPGSWSSCGEEIECCPTPRENCACIDGVKVQISYFEHPKTYELTGFRRMDTMVMLSSAPSWVDCCASVSCSPTIVTAGNYSVGYNGNTGETTDELTFATSLESAFGVSGISVVFNGGNAFDIIFQSGFDLSNLTNITNTLLPVTYSVNNNIINVTNAPFGANTGNGGVFTINTFESFEFNFI